MEFNDGILIGRDGDDPGPWWDLTGRVAIVTGAGGWLGAPMAAALAQANATVWLVGRSRDSLQVVEAQLRGRGGHVRVHVADVGQPSAVGRLVEAVFEKDGHVAALVNNAYPLDISDPADRNGPGFSREAGRGVGSYWSLIQSCEALLHESVRIHGDASVINIASMYGKVSPYPEVYIRTSEPPNPLIYGVGKAGVLQLTRWLATNLGADGIRVNSVSPGAFPQGKVWQRNPGFVDELAKHNPLGRVGQRAEIGPAVAFLASRGSTYVTGSDLAVDGGWTAW